MNVKAPVNGAFLFLGITIKRRQSRYKSRPMLGVPDR